MIFPLPYSSYVNTSGEPVLSQHSTLALEAILLYLKQLSPSVIPAKALREPESRLLIRPDIVIIAEQTFGSKTNKTADLMRQFLVERKVDIRNIQAVEKIANNTYEQLETLSLLQKSTHTPPVIPEATKLCEGYPESILKNLDTPTSHRGMTRQILSFFENKLSQQLIIHNNPVTLIAFTFHVPRINVIAHHLGLNIQVLTVEELLRDTPELANEILKINNSPKMLKVFGMEKLFVGLAKLDKIGLIPKTYSYLIGPRPPLA